MKTGVIKTLIPIIILSSVFLLMRDAGAGDPLSDKKKTLRERMVREQIRFPPDRRDPIRDKRVLDAMRQVPRHLFVREKDRDAAYGDFPLPIGYGQTISQPYIVALMTELLDVKKEHHVLEVGTGSGYQAAVLSLMAESVHSVEIVSPLGRQAKDRMEHLGYKNVHVRTGDGYFGWPEKAPFDRIIVTCAATLVPPPLLRQLRPGGRMCIPIGGPYAVQQLTLILKKADKKMVMKKILPVRFVPLTRTLR
jgi:protein-L-isoaspartate(D-aspartate) O-methyltransferase